MDTSSSVPGRLRKNGPARAHDERDHQLGQQRLDEPAGPKQLRRRVESHAAAPRRSARSKTELSTPNSSMKRPMNRMSQRRGRSTSSGSTLSSARPMAGMSERKLLSRIWPAGSGRNGRNSEATAMLTMLPRLALVVVRMYLSVLAKVLRPFLDAAADHVEVALEQHEVGGLARDVDGLLDRQAGVGRVHRRRVVDAVAEEADDVAHLLQREDDPLLLIRIDLDEEVGALGRAPERLVVQLVELLRRSARARVRRPTSLATCCATSRASPVMTLTGDAELRRARRPRRRDAFLGRSRKVRKPANVEVALVVAAVPRIARRASRVATASTRMPSPLQCS